MDDFLEQALLYDFYGELLTEHQKRIYEDFAFNDLSLSEIAESTGISRQGVHDLVKRCGKQLREYESKLHLVERFLNTKQQIGQIQQLFEQYQKEADEETGKKIEAQLEAVLENI